MTLALRDPRNMMKNVSCAFVPPAPSVVARVKSRQAHSQKIQSGPILGPAFWFNYVNQKIESDSCPIQAKALYNSQLAEFLTSRSSQRISCNQEAATNSTLHFSRLKKTGSASEDFQEAVLRRAAQCSHVTTQVMSSPYLGRVPEFSPICFSASLIVPKPF